MEMEDNGLMVGFAFSALDLLRYSFSGCDFMVFILNYKLFGLLSDVLFYFILFGSVNKSLHI